MNEGDFVMELLTDFQDMSEIDIKEVKTFKELGLPNNGLMVSLGDGSKFQITIAKEEGSKCQQIVV